MRVGIVAQKGNERASALAGELRERLRAVGVEVWLDEATAADQDVPGHPVDALDACEFVVSIGGDGTYLFTARGVGGTPILGVNLGEVGFLNAVGADRAVEAVLSEVRAVQTGRAVVREAPRLSAAGDGWESEPAVNEVVLQGPRRGHGGGVDVDVRVDGSQFSSTHVDGVLVASPTGSTAYNLSEGGPLVHPGVDALVVTEMCATDGMPPLAVPADREIRVRLSGPERGYAISDGRASVELSLPTEVTVTTTEPPVRIAGPEVDFFEALGKLEGD